MIGNRLKMARNAKGMSLRSLAQAVHVSANMIKKYEHNESMPSSSILLRLMTVLEVSLDFLFRPDDVNLGNVEYRKRTKTPKKTLRQIETKVRDHAERWFALKNLWLDFPIQPYQLDLQLPEVKSLDDVEKVAEVLRAHWQLGTSPIPNVIDLLENIGILVLVQDEKDTTPTFDGLQATINNTQPLIVVSSACSGDRQRFTLLHELGHLVLHNHVADDLDLERACDRFAGAFLLPESRLLGELGTKRQHISNTELSVLKHEYGLSMAAILYRARDCGIITHFRHKQAVINFRKNGWHKQEFGEPYKAEKTHLFKQLVHHAVAEDIISTAKGAELLEIPVVEFLEMNNFRQGGF